MRQTHCVPHKSMTKIFMGCVDRVELPEQQLLKKLAASSPILHNYLFQVNHVIIRRYLIQVTECVIE